eukprot:scaffold103100_cov57-Phaeocystis_antarctica.AAC.2
MTNLVRVRAGAGARAKARARARVWVRARVRARAMMTNPISLTSRHLTHACCAWNHDIQPPRFSEASHWERRLTHASSTVCGRVGHGVGHLEIVGVEDEGGERAERGEVVGHAGEGQLAIVLHEGSVGRHPVGRRGMGEQAEREVKHIRRDQPLELQEAEEAVVGVHRSDCSIMARVLCCFVLSVIAAVWCVPFFGAVDFSIKC